MFFVIARKFRSLLSGVGLALLSVAPFSPGKALEWPAQDELASSRLYVAMPAWRRIEHLFTVERLLWSDFDRYASALAQSDCALAQEVLWDAFTSLEPELKKRATRAAVARQWAGFVLHFQFPEFALCIGKEEHSSVIKWLNREGITLAPETAVLGWKRDTDELPLYQRSLISTIQLLFGSAHDDNPDAIRFVLEQDRIGRYVRLTDEQRLSLLVRLIRLGHSGPEQRMRAMKLAQQAPLSTVAAARVYAAREIEPEYERWQAYQRRLRAPELTAAPPGSP